MRIILLVFVAATGLALTQFNAKKLVEISRGPVGDHQIALTFDAGDDADCFDDLIAALDAAQVKSTFFVTGHWAQQNPVCARAIGEHGHEVGNHTLSHLDLTRQPDAIVHDEIVTAEEILTRMCGKSPRPLWRAPYGARDERVLRIAQAAGYRSIYWTIDTMDSTDPSKSAALIYNRVVARPDDQLDGAIILMHVGYQTTADALPLIIGDLTARGFHLVPVSAMIR